MLRHLESSHLAWSQRLACLRAPVDSPSVGAVAAQYALILNDHVVHRSLPSCSPEYTLGFVKEFRVFQAQTSSHLGLCRRSSLCCQLLRRCAQLRRLQRYQFSQLLDLFCCCHDSSTTLPVTIVSPVARSSETVPQPQPQVRTNAPLPYPTPVRKDKGQTTTQTGAKDKMTLEPWSAFMIRMHQ